MNDLVDAPFAPATDGDIYKTPQPRIPMRVLSSRVVVRKIDDEYRGRIIIPKTAKKDPPMKGEVVAVGPGMLTKHGERWTMPDIKPGDIVFFHKWAGQEFRIGSAIDGELYFNLRDDNILAVLEPE